MPHPEVRNDTAFAHEWLVLADEEAVPQCVSLLQATYSISADGELLLLEDQPSPKLDGEWYGDPANSSVRLEPQTAFLKPTTDVILLGHAYAPQPASTEVLVGIRVGALSKVVRVVGDRVLVRRGGVDRVVGPTPFERIALVYERAFGGWDRRADDPGSHRFDSRNPVGRGFRTDVSASADELYLPNIEPIDEPFQRYGDSPQPAGFGFIAPHWQSRARFAGTYDDGWAKSRSPLLPLDFDRRFFNAASPGLVAPTHLRGDEAVVVVGASPSGRVSFDLPAVPPPEWIVELRGRRRLSRTLALDTVIVDMDDLLLTLLWRGHVPVRNGPHDVLAITIRVDSGRR
jgi:hypothetical protein